MTSAKTVEQGNKPHYAWLVMIAYGLMMSGTIGSFSVVGAQWFYPVSTDIGCELSTLTLYTTIEMVCMGLAMPLVGNLLTRVKLPVILIAAVAMEVLATVAMAFYDEPWMWYVSGVFVGLGLAATSTVTVTPSRSPQGERGLKRGRHSRRRGVRDRRSLQGERGLKREPAARLPQLEEVAPRKGSGG